MVRVIDHLEDADSDEVFVFSVYLNPRDGKTVMGYLRPYDFKDEDGNTHSSVKGDLGLDAPTAFREAMAIAEKYGVPFLLINDTARLFPRSRRPSVYAALPAEIYAGG